MNTKGVLPIIATLPIIVIAVAAGDIAHSFIAACIGTSTQNASQVGILSYDIYNMTSPTADDIYLRNPFPRVLTVQVAHIDSLPAVPTAATGNLTIVPGVVQLATSDTGSG